MPWLFACTPSEDSNPSAHPRSLIRVFAGHAVVAKDPGRTSVGGHRRRSACADSKAGLSLHWAYMQSCRKYLALAHAYFPCVFYRVRGMH